ncbi:MAG TPA: hypothetical protein VMM77_02015 [Gemmatimonadaceae bacterium]|nr:hypothetical protein [Gemmatimonadaceae bacterium]
MRAITLPALYLVTGASFDGSLLERLDAALARHIRLVQLRTPGLEAHRDLAAAAAGRCREAGARSGRRRG